MNQELTQRQNLSPTPQTRRLADLLGVYRSRIEKTETGKCLISAGTAPSAADRQTLANRKAELVQSFARADPSLIGPRIARVFLRFPSARIAEPAATVAAYVSDIAEFPLWAIEAGIMSLLRGSAVSNPAFVPSAIEVRRAVEAAVAKAQREVSEIDEVLNAEVVPESTPEQRKRITGLFRETLGELRTAVPPRGGMTAEQIADAERLAALIAADQPDPRPLPPLSEEARRKFVQPVQHGQAAE